jgi:4-alpha-glucanotransferase
MRAGAWGVAERYQRSNQEWHDAPADTVQAVLAALGADADEPPSAGPIVVHPGDRLPGGEPAVVTTEDGRDVELDDATVPSDFPLGYHTLAGGSTLIVSPGRCVLPPERAWGWAVQVYAARSRASWGIGDLDDVRRLAAWSTGELGAGLLLLSPLHAALPGLPQTASPYFPSSRRFRNPLYLHIEEVPGAAEAGVASRLDALAAAGRALDDDRHIDRDAVYRLKLDALEAIWAAFPGDPGFEAYCRSEGDGLATYATFCALAEDHGRPWDGWPAEYRHPERPEVAEYRRSHADRVRFHQWLQWLLDRQLERAGGAVPLVHDLAIGVDPAGADAWMWQDVMARDISVGAPPDEFNTLGQDWGLPPFDPWKLRAAEYRPFIDTVRSGLRHAGGMRLDHVMGLYRLFWIPRGASPADGTYVSYPSADLLDIVALESHRAGAYVVGEDLGTVEDRVRDDLSERDVLSYRLLWFERDEPAQWPEKALAAVTTHDLPTVAGLWRGSDLQAQRDLDLQPNEEGTAESRSFLEGVAGLGEDAPSEEVAVAAYRTLAETPCLLLTATLDDALGVEERPNMPGTTDQWPNWSIALPVSLDELPDQPGPVRIAEALRRAR